MLDKMLFERGEILVKVGGIYDDMSQAIPDYYYYNVLKKEGECVETAGTYLELKEHNKENDSFTVILTTDEFDYDDLQVSELVVECKGFVKQEDGEDYLDITDFKLVSIS